MKVIVEVVFQMPSCVKVCVTSPVRVGKLHENSGGCDGHVCVTEHETVIVELASTTAGTEVINGFSRDAEHVKHKAEHLCGLESKQKKSLIHLNKMKN